MDAINRTSTVSSRTQTTSSRILSHPEGCPRYLLKSSRIQHGSEILVRVGAGTLACPSRAKPGSLTPPDPHPTADPVPALRSPVRLAPQAKMPPHPRFLHAQRP